MSKGCTAYKLFVLLESLQQGESVEITRGINHNHMTEVAVLLPLPLFFFKHPIHSLEDSRQLDFEKKLHWEVYYRNSLLYICDVVSNDPNSCTEVLQNPNTM
uniref:Uncharacterized protein orf101 n=1 Tax=Chaetosphaeridium globosum TaxID=96477 RepID=Q8M1H3_CHAGL|nr:hypothetical protein ChglpMp04 [Chaetosphaeridium globosum]AAM96635.1 hypothetical protein [Chaetosphaeridium globosum]